jgi:hypothetical protein
MASWHRAVLLNYVRISILKGADMPHLQHHGTELCSEESLEDVLKTLSVKVIVVVTMCANEMKIQVNLTMWNVELSAADGH